jgi:thioredoxin 1
MNSIPAIILTHGNFPSVVLRSPLPIFVYFWAEWCHRCTTVSPVVNQLAAQYGDRVKICTVNIDEQPGLAAEYGVRAIPTVVVLRDGQVAGQVVGPTNRCDLENTLDLVMP